MGQLRKYLSVDVGEKRVGLATANSVARLSSPYKTITNNEGIYINLVSIIKDQEVTDIVVGLPRNLEGDETAQTKYVRDFVTKLKDLVGVPIYFQDEALSSVRAKKSLESSSRKYQKEDIDSLAACYILDDFIDNNSKAEL